MKEDDLPKMPVQTYIVPKKDIVSRPPGWNEEDEMSTKYWSDSSYEEDLSGMELARLAQEGHSFDFLSDPEEDIYSLSDGEEY